MGLTVSYSLIGLVNTIFDVLNLLIMIRVILSWLRPNLHTPGVNLVYRLTEPILAPFRGFLSTRGMGLDFSPFFALLFLYVLRGILISLLR